MTAKTATSRIWFFPTSPRTPEKMIGELRLLKQFDGLPWNTETQEQFARLLADYDGFEGEASAANLAFSARDRVNRGPRLLGFVHLPKRGAKNGALRFTDAGNELLAANELELTALFQRQMAKVQFSSPLHNNKGFERMRVRPLLLMVALVAALGHLSKEEVSLFAVTLTDHSKLGERIETVRAYRAALAAKEPGVARKSFRKSFADDWFSAIYAEDIAAGRTGVREGNAEFLVTKQNTARDYADATIRYLRATGLFTLKGGSSRLLLSEARRPDAEFLLATLSAEPRAFLANDYDGYVREYLGNSRVPFIRQDDDQAQALDAKRLFELLDKLGAPGARVQYDAFLAAETPQAKIRSLGHLIATATELQVKEQVTLIKAERQRYLEEIVELFGRIRERGSSLIDKPLFFEWNTWRGLVLINDAVAVTGNFRTDADGNPCGTAAGNRSDIEVEYHTFWLGAEVTLSSGQTQFKMEGDSTVRHVGEIQRRQLAAGDTRPVFGLFVAESLNSATVQHLFTAAQVRYREWGGPVRILPITRAMFVTLMQRASAAQGFSHHIFRRLFESAFNGLSDLDDVAWNERIVSLVTSFADDASSTGSAGPSAPAIAATRGLPS